MLNFIQGLLTLALYLAAYYCCIIGAFMLHSGLGYITVALIFYNIANNLEKKF